MSDSTTVPAPVDPTTQAVQSAVRHLLTAVGALLAGHGLIGAGDAITPENWVFWTGLVISLTPTAWGWYSKFAAAKTAADREAIAVQSGINLVAKGAALATDGSLIASASAAPPLPVTPKTAQTIIQNFGPTTDQLNAMSLKTAKEA